VSPAPLATADHVDIDGARLEFRWFGDGDRNDAIVLLHEGLGSVSMWKSFPQRLAERTGRPVLAYSRSSYGSSTPLAARRDPDYMHHEAETVLPALLSALNIQTPVLLGHSDGASIALLFASRHPTRAVIVEAPHVFVEDLTVESIAQAKVAYETTDLRARLNRYHDEVDGAFWGWNDIWLDPRFRSWNIEDRLADIDVPILVIQGFQDEYGTSAQLDAISAKAKDATLLMIDQCAHSPHRDQPAAVLDAIATFLAEKDPLP
jgi:pimeloyl-ACP methyl ester carboxylesterase